MPAENTDTSTTSQAPMSTDTSAAPSSQPNPAGSGSSSSSTPDPIQSRDQEVTAQLRERMDQMMGVASDKSQKPKEGKDGAAAREPAPDTSDAQGRASKGQDAPDAIKSSPEYKKAVTALRRFQWPKSVIESLSPKDVIAHGENAIRAQAEQDRAGNELAQLRRAQTSPVGSNAGNQAAAQQADGVQGAKPDAEPAGAQAAQRQDQQPGQHPWKELIGQLQGDPVLGNLAPHFEKVFQAQDERYTREIQSLRHQLQEQQQANQQQLEQRAFAEDEANLGHARAGLTKKYGVLADEENWAAVVDRAYALAESGRYHKDGKVDWQKLVTDATRLEFGDGIEKQLSTTARAEFDAQADGQTTPHRDKPRSPKAMTPDEQARMALEKLRQGENPDAVRAAIATR